MAVGSGVGEAVAVGITVAIGDGVGDTVTVGTGVSVSVAVLVGARVAVAVGSGTGVAVTVGVYVAALKVVVMGVIVGVGLGALSAPGSLEQATDTTSSSVASTVTKPTRELTLCGLMVRIVPTPFPETKPRCIVRLRHLLHDPGDRSDHVSQHPPMA